MNAKNFGFFITKLTVTGPHKTDATLSFADGLNVVSGASDTGKSFALSCIDFAFGARDAPRAIPEVSGYRAVLLRIKCRATGEEFEIDRALGGGGRVKVTRFAPDGKQVEVMVIPVKHNPVEPQTLSGLLLEVSGLWGLHVRKNLRGERRPLSFRDIAFLSVVDEERIIAERPPQLSGHYFEKTVESEVFRALITGNESSEVIVAPDKVQVASTEAKMELVATMIENALEDFKKTGVREDRLEQELMEIEDTRGKALAEYERTRMSVTELENTLKDRAHVLREVQSRDAIVVGLTNRFRLLDAHYNSSIERLSSIEETGSLLQSLPAKPCPICGALPESHRLDHADESFRLPAVRAAAQAEAQKIKTLKHDLNGVLVGLGDERNQLLSRADEASGSVKAVQQTIEGELMPRVKQSAGALKAQTERRDILLRAKGLMEQVTKLRAAATDLETLRLSGKSKSPKILSTASSGEMDEFARMVEAVLDAWNYPNPGRVIFSEDDQDLIIGGTSRASHGKGVRALTCAAFLIGLLSHCRNKGLPHPSVVVLDSPLVAYREPDATDGEVKRLRQARVKEAFYGALASKLEDEQVIVFENEDPPTNLEGNVNHHAFTKSNVGRYGFFPR